jgi:hypothetical protein
MGVLENKHIKQIISKIRNGIIYHLKSKENYDEIGPYLMSGISGYALFLMYDFNETSNKKSLIFLNKCFQYLINVNPNKEMDTLSSGTIGRYFTLYQLYRNELIELSPLSDLKNFKQISEQYINDKNFDFLLGSSGIIHFYLIWSIFSKVN